MFRLCLPLAIIQETHPGFFSMFLLVIMGLLGMWHLICPGLLTEFGILVFFTGLNLMEFRVGYLALFLLFSVIDDLEWFWMKSLHKNIQLMQEAPFLVLHFSCCALMIFLAVLSVILLSMLMILLSILSVIGHLICGNNLNWLLNYVKMDGSVLEEKSSFKMLGLTFSSKFDWGSYIISIAKTAPIKIGALICSMKFLSP